MEQTYTCIHCGKKFTAKRSSARFCSKSCCVLWHRKYNKINKDRVNVVQSCEQLIEHTISKDTFKKLTDASEEYLSILNRENEALEKLAQIIESLWLPNKVGSGGIIDLTPLGGNGMIKIEFIEKK